MRAQEQASPAEMKSIGAGLCIAGACGVLIGIDVLPVPGGREALHGPLWIATLIGLVVLLAGFGLLIQGFGRANAQAEFPADAPRWMRAAQSLILAAVFALFAAIGGWVAFAGEAGQFSGGIPSLGVFHISFARMMFGFGALVCALGAVAAAVQGARKLSSRE